MNSQTAVWLVVLFLLLAACARRFRFVTTVRNQFLGFRLAFTV